MSHFRKMIHRTSKRWKKGRTCYFREGKSCLARRCRQKSRERRRTSKARYSIFCSCFVFCQTEREGYIAITTVDRKKCRCQGRGIFYSGDFLYRLTSSARIRYFRMKEANDPCSNKQERSVLSSASLRRNDDLFKVRCAERYREHGRISLKNGKRKVPKFGTAFPILQKVMKKAPGLLCPDASRQWFRGSP